MQKEVENVKTGLTEKIGEEIIGKPAGTYHVVFSKEADPLPLHEETPVIITGIIDTPARWLEARKTLIAGLGAHVIVDREYMIIKLITEERGHFKNIIQGGLELHPAYIRFGINSNEYRTTFQMADLIKMNRSFFEQKSDAMSLVTLLKNFKAKVDQEIEKKNENNGNYKFLREQAVTHNLPSSFKMKLPIFKGQDAITIEVELYIEPEEFKCTLISPEANDEAESVKNTAINDVLKRINAAHPEIVIIEK